VNGKRRDWGCCDMSHLFGMQERMRIEGLYRERRDQVQRQGQFVTHCACCGCIMGIEVESISVLYCSYCMKGLDRNQDSLPASVVRGVKFGMELEGVTGD